MTFVESELHVCDDLSVCQATCPSWLPRLAGALLAEDAHLRFSDEHDSPPAAGVLRFPGGAPGLPSCLLLVAARLLESESASVTRSELFLFGLWSVLRGHQSHCWTFSSLPHVWFGLLNGTWSLPTLGASLRLPSSSLSVSSAVSRPVPHTSTKCRGPLISKELQALVHIGSVCRVSGC